jgi:3-dehydroquinate dehydratase
MPRQSRGAEPREIPVVEVHMTNLYARDPERRFSLTGSAVAGVIMGFGPGSYELGLHALAAMIGAGVKRRRKGKAR